MEVVVAAGVDEGRGLCLRSGEAFAGVGEEFGGELPAWGNDLFDEEAAVEIVAVLKLRDDSVSEAADETPRADVFLEPDGEFVPGFADAETFGVAAGGELEHGEGANLGAVSGLVEPGVFDAEFDILQAEGGGADAAGGVNGVVGGDDGTEGKDDVELDAGDGTPVEFEAGSDGVELGGCAVGGAEGVGLVVAEIDGGWVVGLEGWAGLGVESGGGEQEGEDAACDAAQARWVRWHGEPMGCGVELWRRHADRISRFVRRELRIRITAWTGGFEL